MKAFTDIEQSKKLAEILPLKSADMYYWCGDSIRIGGYKAIDKENDIPCWSLAALLDTLPVLKRIGYEKAKPNIHFDIYTNTWICNSLYYTSKNYDNPVDACVEMIVKLHELKML